MSDDTLKMTEPELVTLAELILVEITAKAEPIAANEIVTHALLCFQDRCHLTARAIDLLARTFGDAAGNDLGALMRVLWDASLQAAYIAHDPSEASDRAQLFLDFDHIERMQLGRHVLRHDTALSRYLNSSPNLAAAQVQLDTNYNRVKSMFMDKKGRVRNHWYAGDLPSLARAIGKEAEHETLFWHFHGSVHSSYRVLTRGPYAPSEGAASWAYFVTGRVAAAIVAHARLQITEISRQFLDCAVNFDAIGIAINPSSVSRQP